MCRAGVAQRIESEHQQKNTHARGDDVPGRLRRITLSMLEHRAPGGCRWLDAQARGSSGQPRSSIAMPIASVASTRIGVIAFGSTWWRTMRKSLAPQQRLAITNSWSLSTSTVPRTTRAKRGEYTTPTVSTIVSAVVPKATTTRIANRIDGNAIRPSWMRIASASIHPPRYPEISPSGTPIASARPDPRQADDQLQPCAVDDAAEDVSSKFVGAHQDAPTDGASSRSPTPILFGS